MDKLDEIFTRQTQLMNKYGFKGPIDIDTKEGQNKIREIMFYVAHELFEASEWLKMKPWRKTLVKTDIPAFKEELADVTHFFIELCITLGINSNEFYKLYSIKYTKNLKRIKDEY